MELTVKCKAVLLDEENNEWGCEVQQYIDGKNNLYGEEFNITSDLLQGVDEIFEKTIGKDSFLQNGEEFHITIRCR